jgi:hypothetical protein
MKLLGLFVISIGQVLAMDLYGENPIPASIFGGIILGTAMFLGGNDA